ncbi:hypothetical protein CANMA_002639 [Candida margitis]|uniref:uncharacterized protein n=1 Tax=Candida margitis TaxID=1775924 RepID=UPI002226137B|nr:uncharacterized protein CANMA_002639 [Candida margitis]KAI5967871.1 hypothetical protein CANMA_002639 [Candida margitis]
MPLPLLPTEIIENILFYIDDGDTFDYLQSVPELTSLILNYRRPTVNIDKTTTWQHNAIYPMEDLFYERSRYNYMPRLVVSDITSVCQMLDSGVDLHGLKFKIDVDASNTNVQVQRVLDNAEMFELSIDRTLEVGPNLKHLSVCNWTTEYPSQLESLKISNFLPQVMYPIPSTIVKLELFDPQLDKYQLPISIRELQIGEKHKLQTHMDFTYLINLNSFEFRGNVEKGYAKTLSDIQLPKAIESLSLECTRMVSLDGIEAFTNLRKLRVIDCPDLILFFTPEFPSSLTSLEFSFVNCRQRLFERNRIIFQIPGRNPMTSVKFMYGNGGIILVVEDEFQPPPSLKTLILKNHQQVYFGSRLNLPNLQTLMVEKMFKLNCGKLFAGLSTSTNLNRLMLKDSSIDCIDDVKFPANLCHLDLSANLLSSIRNTNLKQANHLHSLNLFNNRFTSTNDIEIPANLQKLNLYRNEFHMCNYSRTNLTKLDMLLPMEVRFHWNMLPNTLMYLSIDCEGQRIKQAPSTFTSLRKLTLYSLMGYPIRLENMNFTGLSNLYHLELRDIHSCSFTDFQLPPSVIHVNIMSARDVHCPWSSLKPCRKLKSLKFENVGFDEIDFDVLPRSLEELKLVNAPHVSTCGTICNLHNLRVLDMSSSSVTRLASFCIDLPESLVVLKINFCQFIATSADFINCPNLRVLVIFRYNLWHTEDRVHLQTFISEMLAKCPKLHRVFLSDTEAKNPLFAKFGSIVNP